MRRLLARLALVLVSFLVALALAEAGVRLFARQDLVTEDLRYEAHPTVGFRLEPLTYVDHRIPSRINNLGLRGEDVDSKASGEHRVLMLGDSFTFGAGVAVEEAFPQRLDRMLPGAAPIEEGKTTRVVNGGTPSYGTLRELAWLKAFGDDVDADEIVLCFFVGNDFTDNTDATPHIFDGRMFDAEHGEESDWQLRLRIWRHKSHLYRLLARGRTQAEAAPEPASQEPAPQYTEEQKRAYLDQLHNNFALEQAPRLAIYARPENQSPATAEAYAATERGLDGVRDWCRAAGVPLSVVIIPDVMQVEDHIIQRVLAQVPALDPATADFVRPQTFVRTWCEANGIPVVDLLQPMRQRTQELKAGDPEASLYLFTDSHWNADGHAFGAERIARVLWDRP